MGKRIAGAILWLSAALLFSVRHLAAAILMADWTTLTQDSIQFALSGMGPALLILSIISLAAGVALFIWAEVEKKDG